MCQSLLRRPRHTSTSSPALLSACFTRSSSPLPHSQLLPSLRGALTSVVHSPGPEAVIRVRGETDRQTDELSNDEKVGGWGGARQCLRREHAAGRPPPPSGTVRRRYADELAAALRDAREARYFTNTRFQEKWVKHTFSTFTKVMHPLKGCDTAITANLNL